MSKLVVAVCDTEDGYRNRFVTYLVEHKAAEMTVHAFSTLETLLDAAKKRTFDAVLLGRGFEAAADILREQGAALLLLTDDLPERVAESDEYQAKQQPKAVNVFRYQSVDMILHEMQALTGQRMAVPAGETALASRMEVVGVYSPIRHEMQMPFSVILAALLSEKRKTLYIDLMENSGFLEMFHLAVEYDFGDFVLAIRGRRLQPETYWRSLYESEGMYYIPPFRSPENLHELTLEDYLAFLAFLEEATDFETVVIDFGEGLADFGRMLGRCTGIYCPVRQGFFFDCQLNQFLAYLENASESGIRERLHLVDLPFSAKGIRSGGDTLRQLQWSEFGDYVRRYVNGGTV